MKNLPKCKRCGIKLEIEPTKVRTWREAEVPKKNLKGFLKQQEKLKNIWVKKVFRASFFQIFFCPSCEQRYIVESKLHEVQLTKGYLEFKKK